jgi:hypothetical protein
MNEDGSVKVECPGCGKLIRVNFGYDIDVTFNRQGDAELCGDDGTVPETRRDNTDPVAREGVTGPERVFGEVVETVRAGFEAVPADGRPVRRFGSRAEAVAYVQQAV